MFLHGSPSIQECLFDEDGVMISHTIDFIVDGKSVDEITAKLEEMKTSLNKPIFLLNNKYFPFFDTTHSDSVSNSISLINLNSIKDFENKNNIIIKIFTIRIIDFIYKMNTMIK